MRPITVVQDDCWITVKDSESGTVYYDGDYDVRAADLLGLVGFEVTVVLVDDE